MSNACVKAACHGQIPRKERIQGKKGCLLRPSKGKTICGGGKPKLFGTGSNTHGETYLAQHTQPRRMMQLRVEAACIKVSALFAKMLCTKIVYMVLTSYLGAAQGSGEAQPLISEDRNELLKFSKTKQPCTAHSRQQLFVSQSSAAVVFGLLQFDALFQQAKAKLLACPARLLLNLLSGSEQWGDKQAREERTASDDVGSAKIQCPGI
eukprot:scaffold78299_cov18-Tisochrysis_lutea.AAC.2